MASINVSSYGQTSATFLISGLTVGNQVRIFVREADGDQTTMLDTIRTATGSTMTQPVSGLSPGTEYAYNIAYPWTENNNPWGTTKYFTTREASTRPSDWAWTSTIASGKPVQIKATEWNNFCSRINMFRSYKGMSSYSFTKATSGAEISAAIVNEARTAISAISGHGTLPSAAVSGGKMYASFFTGLASALNAIS